MPAPNPGARWNSADIGLSGGVFNGGAPNLGGQSQTVSTARGFSGLGPISQGHLSWGSAGGGTSHPRMLDRKMIK